MYTHSGSPVWVAQHLVYFGFFNADVRPVVLEELHVADERAVVEIVIVLKRCRYLVLYEWLGRLEKLCTGSAYFLKFQPLFGMKTENKDCIHSFRLET